jgi:hypothetical protein
VETNGIIGGNFESEKRAPHIWSDPPVGDGVARVPVSVIVLRASFQNTFFVYLVPAALQLLEAEPHVLLPSSFSVVTRFMVVPVRK